MNYKKCLAVLSLLLVPLSIYGMDSTEKELAKEAVQLLVSSDYKKYQSKMPTAEEHVCNAVGCFVASPLDYSETATITKQDLVQRIYFELLNELSLLDFTQIQSDEMDIAYKNVPMYSLWTYVDYFKSFFIASPEKQWDPNCLANLLAYQKLFIICRAHYRSGKGAVFNKVTNELDCSQLSNKHKDSIVKIHGALTAQAAIDIPQLNMLNNINFSFKK